MFKLLFPILILSFLSLPFTPRANSAEIENISLPELVVYIREGVTLKDKNGNLTNDGKVLEKIKVFLEQVDLKYRIKALPWNRILRDLPNEENSIITAMAQSKKRLDNFHWILPLKLLDSSLAIFARQDIHPKEPVLKNLIKGGFKPICMTAAIQCDYFEDLGFPPENIVRVDNIKTGTIQSLILRKRADLMIGYENVVKTELKLVGFSEESLVSILKLQSLGNYVVAAKTIDPRILEKIVKGQSKYWDPKL